LVDLARDDAGVTTAAAEAVGWRVSQSGDRRDRRRWPAFAPRSEPAAAPARITGLSATPRPNPLAMPRQDLRARIVAPPIGAGTRARRLPVFAGAAAISLMAGALMFAVLRREGVNPLEWLTLALTALLSFWVGFGFMSATTGFLASLGRPRPLAVANPAAEITARTAILLPTYNEDPGLVLAAVQAIGEDLARLGLADRYDLFVLSDTREPDVARGEAAGFVRLRLRMAAGPAVYYRRRALNTDRKAGNIGDWVERFGGGYDFMLVLDADSLMSGETIAALTAEMQRDGGCGLLQSTPTIVNAETPFARLQQFASRLYGPMFAAGLARWTGAEGNYWGHNALVRVRAFASCAGLPHLPGKKPFGGHILSHDFIEAGLLRRRGWSVRTLAGLGGSYEETPPTLLDTAARDRRWCQGNLQHARLLGAGGLHWVSRLHLLLGIAAYVAPSLWLALVACGAIIWPAQHIPPRSAELAEVVGLFAFMLALLAAPKAMALLLALGRRRERWGFGGAANLLVGFFVECVASTLITPVVMVMQSAAVIEVLLGRDSGWNAQNRQGVELRGRDAWRAHRGHVLLGVGGALGALLVSKYLLMWASPVFLSLGFSALLSLHTSRQKLGSFLRRRGLFEIPEDAAPPAVLERSLALRGAWAAEAADRRRIDLMMREPAAVYEFVQNRPAAAARRTRERQPVTTW
jgi:membrane glycosyltransferase